MSQEQLQCIGCGAILQTAHAELPGYVTPAAYEKALAQTVHYCQRCFKLRHYNRLEQVEVTDQQFLSLLQEVGTKNALVVNVVDVFDLHGSLINGLQRLVNQQQLLIVANKIDLLPKSINRNRLKQNIRRQLKELGIHPLDVFLMTGKRMSDMDDFVALLERESRGRDIYLVGATNVGKSTLVNQLLRYFGEQSEPITVSQYPGTTLDFIRIPLSETQAIIDTPGIIHRHQLTHYLDATVLKKISPQKEIKPRTFQLQAEQTLFFGGLARVDVIGKPCALTCFVESQLYIHRCKTAGATALFDKHRGALLAPTVKDNVDFVRIERSVAAQEDLVISGLGWISVNQATRLAVEVPRGVDVVVRRSLFS